MRRDWTQPVSWGRREFGEAVGRDFRVNDDDTALMMTRVVVPQ